MIDPVQLVSAAIIGIVEGLTEFLPVSSTAHILVTQRILGFEDQGEVFAVVIQLGAILAVCWAMRARLWRAAAGAATQPAERRFLASIAVASLPAAVIGLLANDWLERHVFTAEVVGWVIAATLVLGGLAILLIERLPKQARHVHADALPWRTVLGIGCCQLLALLPGVSRSGATIMGALCLGVGRVAATEFSFFLAIPVMVGASTLKLAKHHAAITPDRLGEIAVGFAVSFVVAWAVVAWLLRYVATRDFVPFAWYRIAAGGILAAALWKGWL